MPAESGSARDVPTGEQEPFRPGAITDWLETEQRPESLYQLLGFSLLDPDFEALASALNTSVRELLPYQNHSTPGVVRKAVDLQGELGNAANILQSPEKFEKHRNATLKSLTGESAQKFGDGDADPDALRKWLESKHECHADAIEQILTALCPPLLDEFEDYGYVPDELDEAAQKALRLLAKKKRIEQEQKSFRRTIMLTLGGGGAGLIVLLLGLLTVVFLVAPLMEWDEDSVQTGPETTVLPDHWRPHLIQRDTTCVLAAAISPAGDQVAVVLNNAQGLARSSESAVRIHNASGRLVRNLSMPESGRWIRFSPDGEFLAIVDSRGTMTMYATDTWQDITDRFASPGVKLLRTAFSSDDQIAALTDRGMVVYDLIEGTERTRVLQPEPGLQGTISRGESMLCLLGRDIGTGTSRQRVAGDFPAVLEFRDVANGQLREQIVIPQITELQDVIYVDAIVTEGLVRFAALSQPQTDGIAKINVWSRTRAPDGAAVRLQLLLPEPNETPVTQIVITPDASAILVLRESQDLIHWNLKDGDVRRIACDAAGFSIWLAVDDSGSSILGEHADFPDTLHQSDLAELSYEECSVVPVSVDVEFHSGGSGGATVARMHGLDEVPELEFDVPTPWLLPMAKSASERTSTLGSQSRRRTDKRLLTSRDGRRLAVRTPLNESTDFLDVCTTEEKPEVVTQLLTVGRDDPLAFSPDVSSLFTFDANRQGFRSLDITAGRWSRFVPVVSPDEERWTALTVLRSPLGESPAEPSGSVQLDAGFDSPISNDYWILGVAGKNTVGRIAIHRSSFDATNLTPATTVNSECHIVSLKTLVDSTDGEILDVSFNSNNGSVDVLATVNDVLVSGRVDLITGSEGAWSPVGQRNEIAAMEIGPQNGKLLVLDSESDVVSESSDGVVHFPASGNESVRAATWLSESGLLECRDDGSLLTVAVTDTGRHELGTLIDPQQVFPTIERWVTFSRVDADKPEWIASTHGRLVRSIRNSTSFETAQSGEWLSLATDDGVYLLRIPPELVTSLEARASSLNE